MVAVISYAAAQRPVYLATEANLAPTDRIIRLYGQNKIAERIDLGASKKVIGGVDILVNDTTGWPDDTQLILHVRTDGQEDDIRTVMGDLGSRRKTIKQIITSSLDSGLVEDTVLYFRWQPIRADERGEVISFALEAPSLTAKNALAVRYEIDATKYPAGEMFYRGQEKAGDLGFIMYEQPRIGTMAARWLVRDDTRLAWVGIGLTALALGILIFIRNKQKELPDIDMVVKKRQEGAMKRFVWWSWALIAAAVVWQFYPALNMYFIQDDIPKLLRVEYYKGSPLKLFAGVHHYNSPGNELETPVAFYRPISFSGYTWLLRGIFGLNPMAFMAMNQVLLIILGGGLFWLAWLLFGSRVQALAVTAVWLAHSSQHSLAYWWSLSEILLASIFLIFTFLSYIKWRIDGQTRYFILSLTLFSGALLSKEFALTAILLLPILEYVFTQKKLAVLWRWKRQYAYRYAPFILLAGLYLIARTIALTDPTLYPATREDTSYEISAAPLVVMRNALVYGSRAVEGWAWPDAEWRWLDYVKDGLDTGIQLYPGVIALILYGLMIIWTWRNRWQRSIMLLAGAWWVLWLGPVLLFTKVWNVHWFAPAAWSVGAIVGVALLKIRSGWRRQASGLLLIIVLGAGLWSARNSDEAASRLELGQTARLAVEKFEESARYSNNPSAQTVLFIGVPQDERGTVNAYLLRLMSDVPFDKVEYVKAAPDNPTENQLVVDMRERP